MVDVSVYRIMSAPNRYVFVPGSPFPMCSTCGALIGSEPLHDQVCRPLP